MSILQYNFYPILTPVRVVSTANVSGSYFNGNSNNGVGATLTGSASTLTIDSVAIANGDRVLLADQTNAYENGIYVVSGIGSTWVLTRSDDLNDIENFKVGLQVGVGAGTIGAGSIYTVIEPLPGQIGVDNIVFYPSGSTASFSDVTITSSITIPNNGLHLLDTNASHDLIISPGSDLTADRVLTFTTGDAARTITLSGNPTLSDWFDQSVKAAASPSFAGVTLNNTGLHILDTNASHDLVIVPGSDLTADRNLTLVTGDAARQLTLSGDATLNQDVSSTGNPAFASVTVNNTGLHILDTNASHDLVIVPGSDLTADRNFTITTGDAARTLNISAADVTISAFGASLVDDAANLNALTTIGVKRGTTAAYGGGGTSNAFVAADIVATDIVVASLLSSTNAVSLTTVVPGAATLTVGFSADPGANTVVNWIAIPTV